MPGRTFEAYEAGDSGRPCSFFSRPSCAGFSTAAGCRCAAWSRRATLNVERPLSGGPTPRGRIPQRPEAEIQWSALTGMTVND